MAATAASVKARSRQKVHGGRCTNLQEKDVVLGRLALQSAEDVICIKSWWVKMWSRCICDIFYPFSMASKSPPCILYNLNESEPSCRPMQRNLTHLAHNKVPKLMHMYSLLQDVHGSAALFINTGPVWLGTVRGYVPCLHRGCGRTHGQLKHSQHS